MGYQLSRDISGKALPLFLKIRSGHPNMSSFAYYLEYLTFHMPERLLLPSLEWLVRNNLTEQRFLDFVTETCKNSGLELIRHLTMRLEKEKRPRRLHVRDIQ